MKRNDLQAIGFATAMIIYIIGSAGCESIPCHKLKNGITLCEGEIAIRSRYISDSVPIGKARLRINVFERSWDGGKSDPVRVEIFNIHVFGPRDNEMKRKYAIMNQPYETDVSTGDIEIFVFAIDKQYAQTLKIPATQSQEVIEIKVILGGARID